MNVPNLNSQAIHIFRKLFRHSFGKSGYENPVALFNSFIYFIEQVINGLRGAGVQVVAIGETTCGKPVGFQPTAYCGQTYSAVNFESVNHLDEGRYFSGFTPTCAVAEDFAVPQGSTVDPLMAAARTVADTGACPLTADGQRSPLAARGDGDVPVSRVRPLSEGDPRPGMIPH